MLLCLPLTMQSQVISTPGNDTCFTQWQVKEIHKIILEYETCKKVNALQQEQLLSYEKIDSLWTQKEILYQQDVEQKEKKIRSLRLGKQVFMVATGVLTIILIAR